MPFPSSAVYAPSNPPRCCASSSRRGAVRPAERNAPTGTMRHGGMRERPNRMVSKTIVGQPTVGSNPTPSATAAARGSVEETGLDVWHPASGPLLVHVDVHPAPRGHLHLDLRYVLHAPDTEPSPAPGESPDARWFTFDEADAVADESLRNALRAVRTVLGDAR